jgi:hypothetical protein
LNFCRQGFTGVPLTLIFDIADLKPKCLHAEVIKSVALLADHGETLSLLAEPIELSVELDKEELHAPTFGMKSKMFTLASKTVTWNWATPVPIVHTPAIKPANGPRITQIERNKEIGR